MIDSISKSRPLTGAFVTILIILFGTTYLSEVQAQDNTPLRLSLAVSLGFTPEATLGGDENAGMLIGAHGELEYGSLIGRLQITRPLLSTFSPDDNLDGGTAYHGSLGYRADLSDKFHIGVLASGGAAVVKYNVGVNGSRGNEFTNVSPQVGLIVAPTYQLNDHLSLQGGLRYYKGFEAGDRGFATNLTDFSIAIRYTL